MINSTVYYLLVLTWGLRYFRKRENIRKRVPWNRGLRHLCTLFIGGFKIIPCKLCLLFNCFLLIKRILKALFSFIPWLLNNSELPSYVSNSRKRYTLTLLSMCLEGLLPILGVKPPHFDSLFDSLKWALFSLALDLCSS